MGNNSSKDDENEPELTDDDYPQSTEIHLSEDCRYISVTPRSVDLYWNPRQERYTSAAKLLRRKCRCPLQMGSRTEAHFSNRCKWGRYERSDGGYGCKLRKECQCYTIGDPLPYNEP
uniref:Uncharacterized protein n=1 Tax=Branchiostoma floridae TaxID=7739 RepID=C3YCW6_BRAFL|eukprot:XP_002605907.1 hypothetical protein BRAFLDRAFT_87420 [Branchiostoma floridae]